MKKLLILILSLALLCLSSCTVRRETSRYEEQEISAGGNTVLLTEPDYESLLAYYQYYLCDERFSHYEIYLPRVGTLTTDDGEEFVSEVTVTSFTLNAATPSIGMRLYFKLSIYSPSGELIVSESLLSMHKGGIGDIEEVEVSDAIAKYWNAVKATPDEMFRADGN